MVNKIKISSMQELQDVIFLKKFDRGIGRYRDLYVYRGLPDANYNLVTSLQRICKNKRQYLEQSVLDNFGKYAELEDPSVKESVWRTMILGQHHGLPTRLLDWSKSPLLALHFATTEGDMDMLDQRDCVLWRVDVEKLHEALPKEFQEKMKEKNQKVFTVGMLSDICKDLKSYDTAMGSDKMVMLEPPSIDPRIVNQYSFFSIVPSSVEKVEDVLECYPEAVTKFVIDKNLRWQIRDMLDQSNINERIVYPGLDGIATWLARHYFVRNMNRLKVVKKNLTDLDADVIVNSSNSKMEFSAGVSKAILHAAGEKELKEACKSFRNMKKTDIAATPGFKLKAKEILHVISPIWTDGENNIEAIENLKGIYVNCLNWAQEHNYHSIGFPVISSGKSGFPKELAWEIAISECHKYREEHVGYPLDIIFCVTSENNYAFGEHAINRVVNHIDEELHLPISSGRTLRIGEFLENG